MPFSLGSLIKSKPKSAGELISRLRSNLVELESTSKEKNVEKAGKELTELIALLKVCLMGDDPPAQPPSAQDVQTYVNALAKSDVMYHMIARLHKLHFETRKEVVAVFSFFCKYRPSSNDGSSGNGSLHGMPSRNDLLSGSMHDLNALGKPMTDTPGLEYVKSNPALLEKLCAGYKDHTIALNCGVMLRDALRDPLITRHILESTLLDDFFGYVQINAFEVASDAFTTFERLLTKHAVVADFLNSQFQRFFSQYEQLLQSDANYATQRQSLKLLQDILLEKRNVHVMYQYVKSKRQLMLIMNLLRSSSKSIQYEAFHVFKVFVANPKKPRDIRGILIGNRDKLLRFLKQLLVDREADETDFAREKEDVMKEIEMLQLEEDDSVALSEGFMRSISMNSREIGSFQSIPGSFQSITGLAHSTAGGSRQLLHQHDVDHSGQSISQALANHAPGADVNGSN